MENAISQLAKAGGKRSTAYRADIDGLRAVSVLLVVGYHAQFWPVSGGFIGVDIFFVISGFLITGIILRQLRAGTFSFAGFYARRVRRIFPALIVVLAAAYLIGWFLLLPDDFALLGSGTAAGVAFASNLFQLRHTGYFAPNAAENPLLHLWSLGIEEQFYIFWPPLLLLIFGTKRRSVVLATVAAASFGVSLMIFFGYKEWSFYSPLPRAWELLAGGIVANSQVDDSWNRSWQFPHRDNVLASLGILAILGAAISLNTESLFPGLYALLPILGAVLIIVSPNSAVNKVLLSSRPMVLIGLISYPLYLWHWPLLSYLGILQAGNPNVLDKWAAIIIAIVLAWLTFRFVEIPLRHRPDVVARLSFALLAVGVVGLVTAIGSGFAFRFPTEIRDIAQISRQDNTGFRDRCFLEAPDARLDANCIEVGDKPLLFAWGDSTSAALYPGLKQAQLTVPFRLAHFAAPGCAPILATGPNCDAVNNRVFNFLKSSHPQIVLLHAMWDRSDDLDKLRETIGQLKAIGVPRIVILGPVPLWKRSLPHALVNYYRFRHAIADRITSGVSGAGGDEKMQTFSRAAGVEYISAWQVLCNAAGCLTRVGPTAKDVVTTDLVHLSDAGSIFLVEAIKSKLFPPS